MNPSSRIQYILLISFVFIIACVTLTFKERVIDSTFIVSDKQLLLKEHQDAGEVVSISGSGMQFDVSSRLLIEEPDVLATYVEYREFMSEQEKMASTFQGDEIELKFASGATYIEKIRAKKIADLPFSFYWQIVLGLFSIAIGGSIWAFRPNEVSARIYFMMGFMVSLFCFASSVYTTRLLYFDAAWFRCLSIINHMGSLGFGAGLMLLFGIYPTRILNKFVLGIGLLSFLPLLAIDTFQWFDSTATGYHLWPLVYTLIAFFLASMQWWKTRKLPAERAVLQWMLLSIMATTLIFVAFNILPAFFAATTLGPQALTLSGFAIGFGMMALGLRRYRLFNLDKWWYQYWFWLLAGASVVLVDVAIISFFGLGQSSAIALSLLFVSWLYFPARQWLLMRFRPEAKTSLTKVLPVVTEELFSENSREGIHQAWGRILTYVFSPLESKNEQSGSATELKENGQCLVVASLSGFNGYLLSYPEQGRRLFSPQDIQLVEIMFEVVHRAELGLLAREQGAVEERARIKRDLHDDLGARLLSLTHSMNLDGSRQQARRAVGELRYILSELEQESCQLPEALEIWQAECRERLANSGFDLEWHESALPAVNLSPRARHNLSRILRELTSNVIKHSTGDAVSVAISAEGSTGYIEFSDNGQGFSDASQEQSFGMEIVSSRIKELQGDVDWSMSQAGYKVSFHFSI